MEDSVTDLLRSIGLSEKEARMYLVLLRHGTQATSMLAGKVGMNRGTAYVILHALVQKGLAAKTTRKSVQYFSPTPPEQILRVLDHEQQRIVANRHRAQAMMGMLEAIRNPLASTPKIEFFDGPEGARFVLNQTLRSKEKLLRAFLSIADIAAYLSADFFNDYTTRRIETGYTLHAIRTLEKDRQAFVTDPFARRYVTNAKERREIRHVSDDLAFPITMYMFDSTLAIISSKEENFSVLVESKELAQMQKKLFDLLWNTAKKMPAR